MSEKLPKVFICYSHQNQPEAIKLYEKLRENGFESFLDCRSILPGDIWDYAVQQALEQCGAMVTLNTENFNRSQNTIDEAVYFIEAHKPIYPLLLDDTRPFYRLARYQHIDATQDYQQAIQTLVQYLRHQIGGSPQEPPDDVVTPAQTGLSLDSFTSSDTCDYIDLIKNAQTEIRILGRIGRRIIVENNGAALEEAAKQGRKIKLLTADEEQLPQLVLWSRSPNPKADHYRLDQEKALQIMRLFARNSPDSNNIQVRRLKVLSSYSHFQVDPESATSTIYIFMYLFRSKPRERLAFKIERSVSPQTWKHFNDAFERFWDFSTGTDEDLS